MPCLKPRDQIEFLFLIELIFLNLLVLLFEWIFLECGTDKGSCLHDADIFLPCIHISL